MTKQLTHTLDAYEKRLHQNKVTTLYGEFVGQSFYYSRGEGERGYEKNLKPQTGRQNV